MKRQLTILILLAINLTVFGQHNLGLKVNGGLSRISNSLIDVSNGTDKIQFALSGCSGIFYNLHLNDKSILEAELLFIQIEGRKHLEFDVTDGFGNKTGTATDDIFEYISYLGLPVYYGLKLNKWIINLGFQVSFTLTSSAREKGQAPSNGEIITWDNKFDELNIDSYDFGPRAGVIFNLNNRFAIEGTYYYGVNNILDNDAPNWLTWKVQQATVGLRYTFLTVTKNNKE